MTFEPHISAATVLQSSGFARVRITAPSAKLREQAVLDMARTIIDHLELPPQLQLR